MSGGSTTKARDPARSAARGGRPEKANAPGGAAVHEPLSVQNYAIKEASLQIREDATGVVVRVRAKPRSSRSRIVGVTEGALDVAIAAPPVDGAANEELLRTLAAHFGLPRRRVTLLAGDSSRQKRVHLAGLTAADVLATELPRR